MLPSLLELLEIENDGDFLDFRCPETGHLLWPFARQIFFRQLISNLYYQNGALMAPARLPSWQKAARTVAKTLLHNAGTAHLRGDILILATGAGHFLRDNRWFNRITDYMALERPDMSVAVEGISDWHVPEPRWNQRVIYSLPQQIKTELRGRIGLRRKHTLQARTILAHAQHRAHRLFGLEVGTEQVHVLTSLIERRISRLRLTQDSCARMLARIRPRLLLMEEACYGDRGIVNFVARDMGIRIAEPQHGMVSRGHDAYWLAPTLLNSTVYHRYLPDDFLSYGRWWSAQISVPTNAWPVGHPHYSEQVGHLARDGRTSSDILFLSDGEFHKYLALAIELGRMTGSEYRLVVRPHPLERTRVLADFPDLRAGSVHVDDSRDLYGSLANAFAVAGEVSTGLFEAIGFTHRVFLWNTEKARFSLPQHPFSVFSSAEQLAAELRDPSQPFKTRNPEEFWTGDWKGNYRRYIEHALK